MSPTLALLMAASLVGSTPAATSGASGAGVAALAAAGATSPAPAGDVRAPSGAPTGAAPAAAPAGGGGGGEPSSYWGPIPPRRTDNTGVPKAPSRSLWEYPVNLPYWIVAYPVRAVGEGIGWSIVGAEKIGLIAPDRPRLFPLKVGPAVLLFPGFEATTSNGLGATLPIVFPFRSSANMQIKLGATTKGRNKATWGLSVPMTGRTGMGFGAGYRTRRNARFWGIGHTSQEADKSVYRWETSWAGLSYYSADLPRESGWNVRAMWTAAHAFGSDSSDEPPLGEVFEDELPPGYRDRSEGVTLAAAFRNDTTEELGRPQHGGIRRGKIAWYRETTGPDIEFMAYRVELQQFFRLWHSKRTFAVRGLTSFLDKLGDDPIPFQRLLTNDDPDAFRGYPDERFRDRGLLLVSAEYRFPGWADKSADHLGVDVALFVDAGQVFEDAQDIAMNHMTWSYGVGFRAAAFGRYIGSMQLGFSEEGFQFVLSSQQTFQATDASLYQGSNPVPER